ncbi:replication initiator protein [Capybara microvirus Cap1_SP_59]|nr:replication initiator protein [Capybara microvirus Cap1_SP_59]
MCISKIGIRSKDLVYNQYTPAFRSVPCGICPQCLNTKRNNMYIRSFFEWQHTLKEGGFVLFPTYTFQDSDLPYFDMRDGSLHRGVQDSYHLDDYICPCFDFSDIRGTKGIVKAIRSHARDVWNVVGVKYVVCPEYGPTPNKTHRPHFHCLFFCPPSPLGSLDGDLQRRYKDDMAKFCLKVWSERKGHGTASYSKKYGPFIESFKGIKYASKYMTKDVVDLCENCPRLKKFLHHNTYDNKVFLPDNWQEIPLYELPYQYRYKAIKPFLPRPLWCKGFGESILQLLTDSTDEQLTDLLVNGIKIDGDISLDGKQNTYQIPRYIQQKFTWHTFDGYDIYNSRLSRALRNVYEQRLNQKSLLLRNFFYNSHKYMHIWNDLHSPFDLKDLLSRISPTQLACYSEIMCTNFAKSDFEDINSLPFPDVEYKEMTLKYMLDRIIYHKPNIKCLPHLKGLFKPLEAHKPYINDEFSLLLHFYSKCMQEDVNKQLYLRRKKRHHDAIVQAELLPTLIKYEY